VYKVTPHTHCRLKLLKLEQIKDFLLMEEELICNPGEAEASGTEKRGQFHSCNM